MGLSIISTVESELAQSKDEFSSSVKYQNLKLVLQLKMVTTGYFYGGGIQQFLLERFSQSHQDHHCVLM